MYFVKNLKIEVVEKMKVDIVHVIGTLPVLIFVTDTDCLLCEVGY